MSSAVSWLDFSTAEDTSEGSSRNAKTDSFPSREMNFVPLVQTQLLNPLVDMTPLDLSLHLCSVYVPVHPCGSVEGPDTVSIGAFETTCMFPVRGLCRSLATYSVSCSDCPLYGSEGSAEGIPPSRVLEPSWSR